MPVPATHVFGGIVTAADINNIAAATNVNETEIAARWNRILTKRTITTAYTLVAADAIDMVLHCTSASDVNVTLPQDSDASIAQGTMIPWRQYGAGEMTFIAGTGAVVTGRGGATKTLGQYTEGYVTKAAPNAWVVSGSTVVPAVGSAPGAPTSVTAVSMGPSRVRVMWTAPSTGTVTGYKVYRGGVLQTTLVGTTTTAHLDTALKKEIAQEIVCTAENSTLDWRAQYGYLEDIGDGRGYTGGIIGFTSGTSDMLTLVQLYNSRAPGNVLQPYTQALINVNGTDSHTGLGAGFETAWATAAMDPVFKKCQDDERDRVYFGPAVAAGVADGLRALGQFIYYDTYVNHGPGTDPDSFDGIRSEAKTRSTPPSQGGDESAYLLDFIQSRKESLERWGYTEFTRTEAQNGFVNSGNMNLIPPLSWSMYGDPFVIAGLPWVDTTTTGQTAYSYTVTAIGSDGLESSASSAANVTTTATLDTKLASKVTLWKGLLENSESTFSSTYYAGINSYTAPVRYYTTTSVQSAITAASTIAALRTAMGPFETTYGFTVRYTTTAGSDTSPYTANSYTAFSEADLPELKIASKYIIEEFAKYPPAWVTAGPLTILSLSPSFTSSGTPYVAIHQNGGNGTSRIYMRLNQGAGPPSVAGENFRRTLHHEYGHVIVAQNSAASAAMQTAWTQHNASAYGSVFAGNADHPTSFIDAYAMTSFVEDQPQVHASLMTQPRYNQLADWIGLAQLPQPTASADPGDAYRYYRFRPTSLRQDWSYVQLSEFALYNGTTRLFGAVPKTQLVSLIQNVTTSSAHVYTAKDSSNNTMDTVKVIDDPDGGYFAVYHSGTTVRLARSTNLTTWTNPVVLDTLSSQPTIRYLSTTGGFLVGMEHHASGGQIRIKHYTTRANLLANVASHTFTATRQLSPCNEGTPHFESVSLNPDINTSTIVIGMHHHECDLPADTDRQSVGTLTNFTSWSSVKTPAVSQALITAAAAAGQTVNGNIGDRDNITWAGQRYGLHEVQYNFGPTGQNNSFASWRAYLYDVNAVTAQLINMTTHNGSTAFANPSWSLVTSPTGVPAIVICMFLPSEGAGSNEAGPLIYWKPVPAMFANQTPEGLANNPFGQTPAQTTDDSMSTKWLSYQGVAATLVYDFGTPTVVTKYKWATGNDFSERDPVSWVVEGSQNNTSWTTLHTVTGYETPITRGAYTQDFVLP